MYASLCSGLDYAGPDIMAPLSFWLATDEDLRSICNGCGPAGWKGKLIPDTIWGLNIRCCCQPHDWMYHWGTTMAEKERADNVFLANIYRYINKHTWFKWLRKLRRHRARIYHLAVVKCGSQYFKAEV